MMSMSAMERPVFASSLRTAGIGPIPTIDGSTPAVAKALKWPSGVMPREAAFSSVINRAAAAPSESGELLPGVTLPLSANAGLRPARPSADVSARMSSSVLYSKVMRSLPL